MIDITKEKFEEYKTVQMSDMFNMFDPKAREMTTLTKDEWVTIMQDYKKLDEAWGDNEKYVENHRLVLVLDTCRIKFDKRVPQSYEDKYGAIH